MRPRSLVNWCRNPSGSVCLMVPESSGSVCFSYLMQMYGIFLTYANIFRKKIKKKRKYFQSVKITDKTR